VRRSFIIRRATLIALALLVTLFSVAPHQHDGLIDDLFKEPSLERIGACSTPNVAHLHAARATRPHPCAACLRQHSAGKLDLVTASHARLFVVSFVTAITAAPINTTIAVAASRGPPR
jgi:hypothetical protein